METELLQDDTLRLRPLEPEDLTLLYTIENDTTQWHIGCQNVPYSRYMLHQYIAESKGDIYADKSLRLVITDPAGSTLYGLVDLYDFDPMHLRAQLGIVVRSAYRHQGIATRTLRLIKNYARYLHLHQLYVYVSCDNECSLQLFRSAGFETQSRLKDWLYIGSVYKDVFLMQSFL